MSPATAFNYYEELQVSQTATQQEVKASYRELALKHHPDKNRDHAEAATAKFQRLGEAYETLSEPEKRRLYDQALATTASYSASDSAAESFATPPRGFPFGDSFTFGGFGRAPFGFHPFDSSPFENAEEMYERGGEDEERSYYIKVGPDMYVKVRCRPGMDTLWDELKRGDDHRATAAAEAHAQAAAQEKDAEEARRKKTRERKQREAEKKARQQAGAAKQEREKQQQQQLEDDREAQEARWTQDNAFTTEQKQATCLHANFWTKVKQNQKLKCASCTKKRGVFGFKCPYCDLLVCQLCQNQLLEEKKRRDKA